MPRIRLGEIAYARSGDKGSGANVGVIAFTPGVYGVLRRALTADAVEELGLRTGMPATAVVKATSMMIEH